MNAGHCGASLSKQYAKGYNCARAVRIHTYPFALLAEVSKSLIRHFLQPFLPLFRCLRVTACPLPLLPALKPSLSLHR